MAQNRNVHFKAILVRPEARKAFEDAKRVLEEQMGVPLNFSQALTVMSNKIMSDIISK